MKFDMDRKVAHGIEMEVARNHAVLLAPSSIVVNRRQEAAGEDALAQFLSSTEIGQRGWLLP